MGKEKKKRQFRQKNKSKGNKEGKEREKRTFKSILVFVSLYFPPLYAFFPWVSCWTHTQKPISLLPVQVLPEFPLLQSSLVLRRLWTKTLHEAFCKTYTVISCISSSYNPLLIKTQVPKAGPLIGTKTTQEPCSTTSHQCSQACSERQSAPLYS